MKEASWNDCLETFNAKKRTPDTAKAKSLRETARARIAFLDQPLTEDNANFIFEGLYASLLELLHAHILLAGYTVTNHICVGFYLRDVLGQKTLYRTFDDCRYKRNGLVYYGKQMPLEVAKESITSAQELIEKIQKLSP